MARPVVLPSALMTVRGEDVQMCALRLCELERESKRDRPRPVSAHTHFAAQVLSCEIVRYVECASAANFWGALDVPIEHGRYLKQSSTPKRLSMAAHSSQGRVAVALRVCVRWCSSRTDITLEAVADVGKEAGLTVCTTGLDETSSAAVQRDNCDAIASVSDVPEKLGIKSTMSARTAALGRRDHFRPTSFVRVPGRAALLVDATDAAHLVIATQLPPKRNVDGCEHSCELNGVLCEVSGILWPNANIQPISGSCISISMSQRNQEGDCSKQTMPLPLPAAVDALNQEPTASSLTTFNWMSAHTTPTTDVCGGLRNSFSTAAIALG